MAGTFKKPVQPVSRASAPAPAKTFTPQPTSESDPNKGQSVRDDAAVHRPTGNTKLNKNKVDQMLSNDKQNQDTLLGNLESNQQQTNQAGMLSPSQQDHAINVAARQATWNEINEFMWGSADDNLTEFVMPWYTVPGGPKTPKNYKISVRGAGALKTYDGVIVGANTADDFARTTSGTFPKNTKMVKETTSYFKKITQGKKWAPYVAAMLAASIGTYPWDGHLKVDNVIGSYAIASRDARLAGDLENAEMLQEALDEFADPSLWRQIQSAIPFWNVVRTTKDAADAAMISNQVNKDITADAVIQQETGETDEQMWARIDERRATQAEEERQRDLDHESQLIRLRDDAKANNRDEDLKYYEQQLQKKEEFSKREEERQREYWLWYWKEYNKYRESSSPSSLSFGLL